MRNAIPLLLILYLDGLDSRLEAHNKASAIRWSAGDDPIAAAIIASSTDVGWIARVEISSPPLPARALSCVAAASRAGAQVLRKVRSGRPTAGSS